MTTVPERLSSALAERYRIERELGAGGMATVYLAHDERHDRKVAIKVLKPELAAVLGAERFVVEIKTTASLQHPHILPLFDSGTADGFLFYVMPYIQGETIREKLNRETQFGVDEALRIAREVADALNYAHRHGVIHRDIKPENILLHDGRAMVMDFGIALAVSAAAGGRMTETGLSLGTPHYMSPEQATAEKEITGRSDIYSLASVLYEMLSGEPPHMGNSAQQIIMKIITETPPLVTTLRKSVPPNVAAALANALEKLPADRFTSASAFGTALADPGFGASFSSVSDAAETARQSWKKLALAASGAAVISLAAAGWAWFRPAARTDSANPWRVQLTLNDSVSLDWGMALSADGSKFVHDGGGRLWLRTASNTTSVPIVGTERGALPSLSPDGQRVAFLRDATSSGELVVVALEGGAAKVLTRADGGIGVAWTDDDHVAYNSFPGYSRVRVSDGTVQPFTTVDSSAGEVFHVEASALPAGTGLLFTTVQRNFDSTFIAVIGPDGGRHTRLLPGRRATFAPPGHLIVSRGDGSILAVPFDIRSRRITGPAVSIISGSPTGMMSTLGRVVVAETGRLIYVASGRGALADNPVDLIWLSRAGVPSPVDTNWVGFFSQVVLSRDGARAALHEWTTNGAHLLVRDLASGSVAPVSLPGAVAQDPTFSPDSRRMWFTGIGTLRGLYRVDPAGAAPPDLVMAFPTFTRFPAFDPTGDNLYFTRGGEGPDELVRMKVSGTQPAPAVIVPGGKRAFTPQVSHDGRWLAFLSTASGRTEVHVRSTDLARSEDWQVASGADLTGGVRWSHGGDELFYMANGSLMGVRVTTSPSFVSGVPRALFSTAGLDVGFDVAADGRFLMIRQRPDRRKPATLVMLERWTDLLPR